MPEKEKILQELLNLANKNKFADEEWAKRGLNPSDESVITYMNDRLEIVIAELILAINDGATIRELKRVLKKGLSRYKRIDLDTEEAEFIVDYFDLLAHIVNIKFGNNLMRWLYGNFLFVLLKVGKIIRPERIIATKRQPCTKCRSEIRVELKRKGSSRKSDWIIGKCMTCQEYNMTESFADAKITGYHNFFPEEHLGKDEYSEEQANIRLEQVKYFRK